MELTNLIWHLGAAIAALWAAFAYRSLNVRYAELTESVLPAVLPVHKNRQGEASEGALSARGRSYRIRAVRWLVAEFGRTHGISCSLDAPQNFGSLEQSRWVAAFSQLFECSQGTAKLPPAPCWQNENGERMSPQAFADALNQFKLQGHKLVLFWCESAFEGQGGWQWRVSV
jgi:hypothetical protein